MIAVPSESPTRMASTPDSSTSRPKRASYAVITTSFSPLRLCSAKSRTVTGRRSDLVLSKTRAPQRRKLSQPEVAIRQFRMRHRQTWLAHALFLEQYDVEIQRARSPPGGANASGVGETQHPRRGEVFNRASRLRQKYLTLAEIGAERYVRDISHARSRSRATSAYASGPGSATLGLRTAIRTRSTNGSWRARSAIRSPTSSRKLV